MNPNLNEDKLVEDARKELKTLIPYLEACAFFYGEEIGRPVSKEEIYSMFRCDCLTMAYGIAGADNSFSQEEIRIADRIFDGF